MESPSPSFEGFASKASVTRFRAELEVERGTAGKASVARRSTRSSKASYRDKALRAGRSPT